MSETTVKNWGGHYQTTEEFCRFLFKSVFNFSLPFQEMKTGNRGRCIKGVFYTRKMTEKALALNQKIHADVCVCMYTHISFMLKYIFVVYIFS